MNKIIFILIGIVFFTSCQTNDNGCGQAYFGGEIINPNNNYVVLYDESAPLDTLYLDKNNRFSYTLNDLKPGLHSFVHGGEYQVAIIEPNDSILLRLNTLDFDESLVFTGNGSKKNNFLISLFLSLEKQDKAMYELSKLKPITFQKQLDSSKNIKQLKLSHFNERNPSSTLFNTIVNNAINYNYYANKELYPSRHFGNNRFTPLDSLPKNYFSFRQHIDYNNETLKDFYPYNNFLFPHFNNLAQEHHSKMVNDTVFNRFALGYNLLKLELIDSLIKNQAIKNNLLKFNTRNFLSFSQSSEDSEAVFNSYSNKNTNVDNQNYISSIYNTLKRISPGNKFPEIEVVNHQDKTLNINSITSKPFVLHFWSKAIKHHIIDSHKKAEALKADYPNVDFISININENPLPVWQRMVKQYSYSFDNEYMFRNPDIAKKILAIHYINKTFVVNKNKDIVTSNGNMFHKDFKTVLDNLEAKTPLLVHR